MTCWRLGDMAVIGEEPPPGPLTAALAVLGDHLHPAYDRETWIKPEWSRQSCILCSLTARDFLRKIGIKARVEPVYFWVRERGIGGDIGHSLGIGNHEQMGQDNPFADALKWSGHMVVVAGDWMIDTTLYQAQRRQWPHLPGMVATPLEWALHGMTMGQTGEGSTAECKWTLQPENKGWRVGGDCAKWRRVNVTKHLLKEVGRA